MNAQGFAYFIFGLTLVTLFGVIIAYYYSKKRSKKTEDPKYRIFDDED